MKQFKVTTSTVQTNHNGERVTILNAQVFIEADYFRVQDGVLIFRRVASRNEQFNPAVRVFAPGFWAEVVEVSAKPPADRPIEHTPPFERMGREVDLPGAEIIPFGERMS